MEKREGWARRERNHFDRLAAEVGEIGSYRKTRAGTRRMRRRAAMVAQLLGEGSGGCILEIGAGAGAFSQFLVEEIPDARILACDISPGCTRIAAERCAGGPRGGWGPGKAFFQVADCIRLPYGDNGFDCVCGCSILHHLPLAPALGECFRVLRPGRFLWFSEPNMMNPQVALEKNLKWVGRWLGDTEDETAFLRWAMTRSLHEAGFTEISVRPFDFVHPHVPGPVVGLLEALGSMAERLPLLREIAGSLAVQARKPR